MFYTRSGEVRDWGRSTEFGIQIGLGRDRKLIKDFAPPTRKPPPQWQPF